jgi:hypothetical protein
VKEKAKNPVGALIEQIDKLGQGQQLMFRLAEMYGPEIIIIEVKKDYAGKGPKFSVIGAPPVDGRPGAARHTIWETGHAKAVAKWLVGRESVPFA